MNRKRWIGLAAAALAAVPAVGLAKEHYTGKLPAAAVEMMPTVEAPAAPAVKSHRSKKVKKAAVAKHKKHKVKKHKHKKA